MRYGMRRLIAAQVVGVNALRQELFPQIASKPLDAFRGAEKEGFEPSFDAERGATRPCTHNAGSASGEEARA